MKTDVTYGFVSGALFVYVHVEPENSKEKGVKDEYLKAVNGIIEHKLKGDQKELEDDHAILGVNYNQQIDKNIQRIISRVVKTACVEFEVDFKLRIKKVEE